MTVLLGPTPCHGCGAPVTVVRRPVMIHGNDHAGGVAWESVGVPSEELREVVTTDDGGVHRCDIARPFDMAYDATDGSSVTSSDTLGDGRAPARPRGAAVPCLEV